MVSTADIEEIVVQADGGGGGGFGARSSGSMRTSSGNTSSMSFEGSGSGSAESEQTEKLLSEKVKDVPEIEETVVTQTRDIFKPQSTFNFNSIVNNINRNLSSRGIPDADLKVMPEAVDIFLEDMANKMYAVTQGEISIEELSEQEKKMYESLIAVSYYESSLGNAKRKPEDGTIDHGNDLTTGMFGLQKEAVNTMHNNGTLGKDVTWNEISSDPHLGDFVGALNALQVNSRAFNITGTFPTIGQAIAINRSGLNGTVFDGKYDVKRSMNNWSENEKTNYSDAIKFLNSVGIKGE